jgi:phosphate-selective porin OprO and OprP
MIRHRLLVMGVLAAWLGASVVVSVRAQDAEAPTAEAEEEGAEQTPAPQLVLEPERRETIPGLYPENVGKLKGTGIWAGTPDRAFTLRTTGFVHLDSRSALTAGPEADSDVFFRRVRLTLDGRLFGQFEYRFMWDQMIDPLIPYDFHLDWRPIHEFNVRVGGFKSSFGFERRARSYALLFIERGFPTALAPNREMGVFLYGQTRDGFFSYDVSVGTGAENLGVLYEFRGSPDLAGRIYFQPFRLRPDLENLKYLGIGFSGTFGREWGRPDDPRLQGVRATPRRSVYGGRLLFDYYDDAEGTTFAHGVRDRQSVHAHWRHGQFNTMFEYVRSANQVARNDGTTTSPARTGYLANHAWQVVLSMTLNPEDQNTFFGVVPSRPFNPRLGQWGGATVAVRYHELYLDPRTFPEFADPDLWARTLRAVGASFQWHVNLLVEVQLDLEVTVPRTAEATNASLPTETAIMTRVELRY